MSNKSITLRFDEETCALLERCARAEERDVAQQARYFVKRGLEAWNQEHPPDEAND